MGTPDFAVPTLERLLVTQDVVAVFTQPDRPAGRGRRLRQSPVKQLALAEDVPVLQPSSLRRDPGAVAALQDLAPDVIVVAAYGLILPPDALSAAPGGGLNVHASLLPRWRGAAPVSHTLLAGDSDTGVTIMKMDEGLDTGPILAQRTIVIEPDETAGELTARLAVLGADVLAEVLPRWMAGEVVPRPQDESVATHAPLLKREDSWLDWSDDAASLACRVRAMNPWPGAITELDGVLFKVHVATPLPSECGGVSGPPGTVVGTASGPAVVTGEGWLRLDEVQPAGRRRMSGSAFARGRPQFIGTRLAPAGTGTS